MIVAMESDSLLKGQLEDFVYSPKVIRVDDFSDSVVGDFADKVSEIISSQQTFLPIVINSYGGDCYNVLAMIDVLKSVDIPILTLALGKTMSAGAILFSQGTKGWRYMASNASMMIHDVASTFDGKIHDLVVDAKEAEKLNKNVFSVMEKGFGVEKNFIWNKIHSMGRADWYLDAKEAKKIGFTDYIGVPRINVKVRVETEILI